MGSLSFFVCYALFFRVDLHRSSHDVDRPRCRVETQGLRRDGHALLHHPVFHLLQGRRRLRGLGVGSRPRATGATAHRRPGAAPGERLACAMAFAARDPGGIFHRAPAGMAFGLPLAERRALFAQGLPVGLEPTRIALAVLAAASRHACATSASQRWLELRAHWRGDTMRHTAACMQGTNRAIGSGKDARTTHGKKSACQDGRGEPPYLTPTDHGVGIIKCLRSPPGDGLRVLPSSARLRPLLWP